MKKSFLLATGLVLAGLVAPTAAVAEKAQGPKARLMAHYDANKNGTHEAGEIVAIRSDFTADPSGALKRFDRDKNGKLSDNEVALMVPGSGKKSSGGKKADGHKKDKTSAK